MSGCMLTKLHCGCDTGGLFDKAFDFDAPALFCHGSPVRPHMNKGPFTNELPASVMWVSA